MKTYDLKKSGGVWVLQPQGSSTPALSFPGNTKEDAIQRSAGYLENLRIPCSLRIHTEGGRYEEERTYPRSADPRRSKG